MNLFRLPVQRPVATSMFFLGVLLLGWISWQRIPVELMPPVSGNELYVNFGRPGSEPTVVEREILMPLEARIAELPDVEETWGEIRDFGGSFRIRFASSTDLKVRELELRRVAAELVRAQPPGSFVNISSQDLAGVSRFVMFVQVIGMEDRNALLDFVQERIEPRLLSVSGVSRVMSGGGAPREVTVLIDPDRCAAAGIFPQQVINTLRKSVRRLEFLGGAEDEAGRTVVILPHSRRRGLRWGPRLLTSGQRKRQAGRYKPNQTQSTDHHCTSSLLTRSRKRR